MSHGAQEFERVIDSDPKLCTALIRELLELLEKENWTQDDIFGIRMAVEEAVMNAIKHGNDEDRDKKVYVEFRLEKESFYARISDQGNGFCPDDVPNPTEESNLEKTSGRGVMLIKSFVDECRYNSCGNSVELLKRRSS